MMVDQDKLAKAFCKKHAHLFKDEDVYEDGLGRFISFEKAGLGAEEEQESPDPSPDMHVELLELQRDVRDAVDKVRVGRQDRQGTAVLRRLFGLGSERNESFSAGTSWGGKHDRMSFDDTGKALGLSGTRARQIEGESFRHLIRREEEFLDHLSEQTKMKLKLRRFNYSR